MIHIVIFYASLIFTTAYAVARGGAPEQIVGWLFILAGVLSSAFLWITPSDAFTHVELAVMMIDAIMLMVLIVLALCADRYWPLWVAGLQLIMVGVHVAKIYDLTMVAWTYSIGSGKLAYPQMALLAAGTWRHQQRLVRYGIDRSWSHFLSLSSQKGQNP